MKKLLILQFILLSFCLSQEVIVNIESGKIHRTDVFHLPDKNQQKKYPSFNLAVDDDHQYCISCFEFSLEIVDYELERKIAKEAIIGIENRYEILYENSNLEKINNILTKVIKSWPEKLKGYEYQIQIIKDDSPNAYAIAGGNIYLTSGLIKMTEFDLELESIIAHEVAHIEKRHTLMLFKDYQKKQMGVQAFVVLLAAASIYTGDDRLAAVTTLAALAGEFAVELLLKGYTRELEEEADIFAQLYFHDNEISKKYLSFTFDKLINYQKTRKGLIENTNAFSDHPSLSERFKQVESGKFYRLDSLIVMSLNPKGMIYKNKIIPNSRLDDIERNFFSKLKSKEVKLYIDKVFTTQSSTSAGRTDIYLMGNGSNDSNLSGYNIDNIEIKFDKKLGSAKFLSSTELAKKTYGDFLAKYTTYNNQAARIVEKIITKNIEIPQVVVSPIRTSAGLLNSRKYLISCTTVVSK